MGRPSGLRGGRERTEVQDGLAEGPPASKETAAGHLGAAPAAASAHAPLQQREYWPVLSWGRWVRWEVKEGWWLEGKGCLCSSSVLFCAFEEMEVFSWRTLKYFPPKNCPFHPSISFSVSHPIPQPGVRLEERPLSCLMCGPQISGQPSLAAGMGPWADKKKDTQPPVVVRAQHVTICL